MKPPYEHGAVMLVRDGQAVFAIPLDSDGKLAPLGHEGTMVHWRMQAGDEIRTVKP